jgi:hypothetical protein
VNLAAALVVVGRRGGDGFFFETQQDGQEIVSYVYGCGLKMHRERLVEKNQSIWPRFCVSEPKTHQKANPNDTLTPVQVKIRKERVRVFFDLDTRTPVQVKICEANGPVRQ